MGKLPSEDLRRPEILPVPSGAGLQHLAVVVVVVVALYFGRDIFVPIALAVLLSFALAPPVSWLRRRRVPRIPAVVGVVFIAFLAIFAFGFVIAGQVSQLAENLPRYQSNIEQKIQALRGTATGGGIIERASEMLRELGDEIAEPSESPADADEAPSSAEAEPEDVEPIPVQIRQPELEPLELLQT